MTDGPPAAVIREREEFDKWAKQEDEWLEAHCPDANPKLEKAK